MAMLFLLLTTTGFARAETVTVAVASNFAETARELAAAYEERSGHEVVLIQGSTGKLHAQIVNGAPFDVFLSADVARAAVLPAAEDGRFIYAIGQLTLWSPDPTLTGADCFAEMVDSDGGRIAIANPALAPYGLAARNYLEEAYRWHVVEDRLVYGESVAQAFQFVATGNARFGFVATGQLDEATLAVGCHSHILKLDGLDQQAVLLERAADNPAARGFFEYLNSDDARARIVRNGYGLYAKS
ncbi:MAG: molybdate ABC transporter substrate-binding protein [Woeseiaceae bacterium]|nr:molybdate ABC transporter substrate-binding protein [Woeseiaceae bacterium]